jgi:hypothetical protein
MAICGSSFQLAFSPSTGMTRLYVEEKVGWMLSAEASLGNMVEGRADQADEEMTIDGLTKKYPWWTSKAPTNRASQMEEEKVKSVLEGKSTFSLM